MLFSSLPNEINNIYSPPPLPPALVSGYLVLVATPRPRCVLASEVTRTLGCKSHRLAGHSNYLSRVLLISKLPCRIDFMIPYFVQQGFCLSSLDYIVERGSHRCVFLLFLLPTRLLFTAWSCVGRFPPCLA